MNILILPFAFALLLFFSLGGPEQIYFDEFYYVRSARALLAGEGWMEMSHPPLGKALMAFSISLLGDTPLGWRLPSVISTLGSGWLVGKIARHLGLSVKLQMGAQFLFLSDGLTFTLGKIGILNAPMLFCMLAAVERVLSWRQGKLADWKMLLSTAFVVSVGCAIKWVALGIIPVILFCVWYRSPRPITRQKTLLPLTVVTFIVGYLICLSPFLLHGELTIHKVLALQWHQLTYHLNLTTPHRYQSPWWSWPLMLRPIWFGFERAPEGDSVRGILAIGNPFVVWPSIPVMLTLTVLFWKKRSFQSGVPVVGFSQQWIQWAFSPHYTMYHYFDTAIPFIALGISVLIATLIPLKLQKGAISIWIAGAGLALIYWYPLWSCLWISDAYYRNHLWLDSWR